MKTIAFLLVIGLVCGMTDISEAKKPNPAIDNTVILCHGYEVEINSNPSSPVCVGTTVQFSIVLPCGWTFVSACWTFSGGTPGTGSGATPSTTYNSPGEDYNVTMTGMAKDECGQSRSISGAMTITVFGVKLTSVTPQYSPLTKQGTLSEHIQIEYKISPSEYTASSIEIQIFNEDGNLVKTITDIEGVPLPLSGIGKGIWEKGSTASPGEYEAQVVLNKGTDIECKSEKIKFYLYQFSYKKVMPPSTHHSIEGSIPGQPGMVRGLLGKYGRYSEKKTLRPTFIELYHRMWSKGENWVKKHGQGAWLRVSGEIRYEVYLDMGKKNHTVTISADWKAAGTIEPVSPLIIRGGHAFVTVKLDGGVKGKYAIVVRNGQKEEYRTGPNPIVGSQTISGKTYIGYLEAAAMYDDYGAKKGEVATKIITRFKIGP